MADVDTHIFRVSLGPKLYRDIELLSTAMLYRLAETIVRAFDFDFDHAFGFFSKLKGNIYQSPTKYELFADTGGRSVKRTPVIEAFAATGTVASTVRRLLACSIRFAQLVWGGEKAGTIIWCDYNRTRVLNVLTNPAYAGAYAYGRRRCRQAPDGHVERRKLKPDAWAVVIPDRFTGYVSWTDFEAIQTQLRSNAQSFGRPNAFGPPREGPALVQGRVMCGRCGSPMYVRYGSIQHHRPRARYVCVDQADARRAACQSVPATDVDAAVARLVLELMTPMAIEMTLAIQGELDRRVAQSEQHHQLRITRARYESDFARRRYDDHADGGGRAGRATPAEAARMTLANPGALWGLLLIPLIILLYVLRQVWPGEDRQRPDDRGARYGRPVLAAPRAQSRLRPASI